MGQCVFICTRPGFYDVTLRDLCDDVITHVEFYGAVI